VLEKSRKNQDSPTNQNNQAGLERSRQNQDLPIIAVRPDSPACQRGREGRDNGVVLLEGQEQPAILPALGLLAVEFLHLLAAGSQPPAVTHELVQHGLDHVGALQDKSCIAGGCHACLAQLEVLARLAAHIDTLWHPKLLF